MKPAENGNINRYEMFEMLARKCKSRGVVSICIGLLFLILTVGIIIFILKYHPERPYCDEEDVICFLISFTVIGCALVSSIPYDYLYIKKIDSIDTPDQLMCLLKKRNRFEKVCFIVPMLVVIACDFYDRFRLYTFRTDLFHSLWVLALVIVFFLCAFHVFKPEKMSYKEEEVVVELEDLIDMR